MDQIKRFVVCIPEILCSIISGILEWIIPAYFRVKDVSQDVVLITGGGSGIGRAMALVYAKLGSTLILWDINEKGLNESKKLIEKEYAKLEVNESRVCLTYLVDVSNKSQVKQFAEQVFEDLNKNKETKDQEAPRYVTVLINNAGIFYNLPLQELKDEQIERIVNINILAHFWTVRAFLPNMIKYEKGHIVEIASMAGLAGLVNSVDYCATKFATVGFEEALSLELYYQGFKDKIHTTVVCPIFISTNLFTGSFDTKAGTLLTPEFVAKETVTAMRCNYSRVLLPQSQCYPLSFVKPFLARGTIFAMGTALGFQESLKDVKGRAASD